MNTSKLAITLLCATALAGCASRDDSVGHYKVGVPYTIKGQTYYPQENFSYEETGIASWYGPGFHGRKTANGEKFDQDEMTAAHRTLQLPSVARVTNLDNGRSVVVRVNDRGPYASNRIMDLSRRAAEELGFIRQGTANVHVQVLENESLQVAAEARAKGGSFQAAKTQYVQIQPVASEPLPAVTREPVLVENNTPQFIRQANAAELETASEQDGAYAQSLDDYIGQQDTGSTAQATTISPSEDMYVQAGTFSVQENARRLQRQLAALGQARIEQTIVNGAEMYRVKVGPVQTAEEARWLKNQVVEAGVRDARVISGQ